MMHHKAPHRPWDPTDEHSAHFSGLRIPEPVTPFSSTGPSSRAQPSSAVRAWSSAQIRSSGQCAGIRIRWSASCQVSGIDAVVQYRPVSP